MQSVAVVSRRRLPRRRADDARRAGMQPTAPYPVGCMPVAALASSRTHSRNARTFGRWRSATPWTSVSCSRLTWWPLRAFNTRAGSTAVACGSQACRNGREAHTPRGALPPAYDSLRSAFATPNWHPLNCVSGTRRTDRWSSDIQNCPPARGRARRETTFSKDVPRGGTVDMTLRKTPSNKREMADCEMITRREVANIFVLAGVCMAVGFGCGDDNAAPTPTAPTTTTPVTTVNRGPQASGTVPSQQLQVGGDAATVNVAQYFSDPDGDTLTYDAASSDTDTVTTGVSGSSVTLTPVAAGTANVTVTASDPAGLNATQAIAVNVERPALPVDPYMPLEGLRVSPGRVQFRFLSAGQCIRMQNTTINGVTYTTHNSKWQRRDDSSAPWTDVAGTEKQGGLCSYSPTNAGEYRLVGEITIDGSRGMYSSENTITV